VITYAFSCDELIIYQSKELAIREWQPICREKSSEPTSGLLAFWF